MTSRPTSQSQHQEGSNIKTNVSEPERVVSVIAGSAAAIFGLTRGNAAGLGLALAGAEAIRRGVTGHCYIYQATGVNTATTGWSDQISVPHHAGIRVDKSITVNRPVQELFSYWRNFENLPNIMEHLKSVTMLSATRSHWIAKGPLNIPIEWDAEIINEKHNELIGWRSLDGASVPNAGSVQFKPAPAGRGTIISVSLKYDPPAGAIGAAFAKLLSSEPNQQVADDLQHFKELMEAGEVATTEGQSSGRK